MKTLQRIYEYFFAPWEITIIEQGKETWVQHWGCGGKISGSEYIRNYVKYKCSHKFRKEEKIVKEYLN